MSLKPKKHLKFIHISKNAGTSIEDLGLSRGIQWGRHQKEYGYQHECFPLKPSYLKDKYDWFLVVRNPYTRVLSEYHYLCGKAAAQHTSQDMNRWIQQQLRYVLQGRRCAENMNWYQRTGDHFTEQVKYLDSSVTQHVLRFENLQEEFDRLMQQYSLPVRLLAWSRRSKKVFSIADFSDETIALIQRIYQEDFQTFGYSLEPPLPAQGASASSLTEGAATAAITGLTVTVSTPLSPTTTLEPLLLEHGKRERNSNGEEEQT